jgi:acyl carrier protein
MRRDVVHYYLRLSVMVWILLLALSGNLFAADSEAVAQRVRAELATLLKKDAAQLPPNKPVMELGADELTIVEWEMALESAYRGIRLDKKTENPNTKKIRTDLTIAEMTKIVSEALAELNR